MQLWRSSDGGNAEVKLEGRWCRCSLKARDELSDAAAARLVSRGPRGLVGAPAEAAVPLVKPSGCLRDLAFEGGGLELLVRNTVGNRARLRGLSSRGPGHGRSDATVLRVARHAVEGCTERLVASREA